MSRSHETSSQGAVGNPSRTILMVGDSNLRGLDPFQRCFHRDTRGAVDVPQSYGEYSRTLFAREQRMVKNGMRFSGNEGPSKRGEAVNGALKINEILGSAQLPPDTFAWVHLSENDYGLSGDPLAVIAEVRAYATYRERDIIAELEKRKRSPREIAVAIDWVKKGTTDPIVSMQAHIFFLNYFLGNEPILDEITIKCFEALNNIMLANSLFDELSADDKKLLIRVGNTDELIEGYYVLARKYLERGYHAEFDLIKRHVDYFFLAYALNEVSDLLAKGELEEAFSKLAEDERLKATRFSKIAALVDFEKREKPFLDVMQDLSEMAVPVIRTITPDKSAVLATATVAYDAYQSFNHPHMPPNSPNTIDKRGETIVAVGKKLQRIFSGVLYHFDLTQFVPFTTPSTDGSAKGFDGLHFDSAQHNQLGPIAYLAAYLVGVKRGIDPRTDVTEVVSAFLDSAQGAQFSADIMAQRYYMQQLDHPPLIDTKKLEALRAAFVDFYDKFVVTPAEVGRADGRYRLFSTSSPRPGSGSSYRGRGSPTPSTASTSSSSSHGSGSPTPLPSDHVRLFDNYVDDPSAGAVSTTPASNDSTRSKAAEVGSRRLAATAAGPANG